MNINSVLPAEILERIFSLVAPRVLRAVVLVCRKWREVGEAACLWSRTRLTVVDSNMALMPEVLGSRRLRSLRRLTLKAVSPQLLETVAGHPGLRGLTLANTSVCRLEPGLLCRLVSRLQEVVLRGACLTSTQATALCCTLTGISRLKSLDLSVNNLSLIDPSLLVGAITRLVEVKLVRTNLTREQASAICSALPHASRLRGLDLSHNNLSSVSPTLLVPAIWSLEEARLWGCSLTGQQLESLCRALRQPGVLRILDMTGNKLSQLEPQLLASAVSKLQEVRLVRTSLTMEQASALCLAKDEQTCLRSLDLSNNNLSAVLPEVLVKAVAWLEELRLWGASLTSRQASALCSSLRHTTTLRSLDLSVNDLSSVEPSLLVAAVTRLVEANLMWTSLTHDQAAALCQGLNDCPRLKSLDLAGNDLSLVRTGLLRHSSRFQHFNITCTDHINIIYHIPWRWAVDGASR